MGCRPLPSVGHIVHLRQDVLRSLGHSEFGVPCQMCIFLPLVVPPATSQGVGVSSQFFAPETSGGLAAWIHLGASSLGTRKVTSK